MNRNKKPKMWLTTIILLVIAFCGLLFIDTGQADADRINNAATSDLSGATANNSTAEDAFSFGTPVASIIKMLSALLIVVICVYGGVYLLKRFMQSKQQKVNGKVLLEVIETTYVGPKKTVSLVRVADKSVLVGVTEQNISVLSELDADETAVILAAENNEDDVSHLSFNGLFDKAINQIRKITTREKSVSAENLV